MLFNASLLLKLGEAVMEGKPNFLLELVEHKLEHIGEEAFHQVVESIAPIDFGIASRVEKAVKTGGFSEFDRYAMQSIRDLRPQPVSHPVNQFQAAVQRGFDNEQKKTGGRRGGYTYITAHGDKLKLDYTGVNWQSSHWAQSRQDWLNNAAYHDWRTQPRNARGQWIAGRLSYIPPSVPQNGRRTVGRTVRRYRKLKRIRQAAARRAARDIFKREED